MTNRGERKYDGLVVTVDVRNVRLPDGTERRFEVVRHPGGAAVVAVDAQRRVCLLKQLRPAVERWMVELPAGKLDAGEAPLRTAQRELEEEAGMHAGQWAPLGAILTSPGVFTEVVHLYLATGLEARTARPEPGEFFSVSWEPLDEACRRALAGEIDDAKTVIGLLRAEAALR
ncbi:MAG TPA: NUDIX hydrolase [Steroidobacteraceae bacterium]|nr:NUDIX hydrolase [Steroidobacteraceae bacterium]